MARYDYDLLVVGAGSGGLAGSKRAASYGARVAIVEADRVGGTCVIRGCIPKKLMVYAAHFADAFEYARGYGWNLEVPRHAWSELARSRDRAVAGLEAAHKKHLADAGVELIEGRACFEQPHHIRVGDRLIRAERVLVATGSTPVLPKLEGDDLTCTSDDLFRLRERPRRVVLVGGGYIAVEFASILRGLGSEVTLVIRRDLPLRGFDPDLRRELLASLQDQGITVLVQSVVDRIARSAEGLQLTIGGPSGKHQRRADEVVLYAIGRRPNSAGLGLEAIGVQLGARGEISTDENARTSVDHVSAIGDVAGRFPLTPVAIQAARAWADRTFGGKDTPMSYEEIPTAVFSSPPIGTVGLGEEQAVGRYGKHDVRIYKSRFHPLLHTLTDRKVATFVKLVVRVHDDRVLGAHIIGHDAPEIIQGFAVALKAGATKADFDATVGIHPSTAEEFVTLG